jgi:hypothetical protein
MAPPADEEPTNMSRTPKLTDTQLILLATACQRDDGSLLPPPYNIGAPGDRIRKAVAALIKRSLAVETEITNAPQQWRQEEDRLIGVVITDAGRAIIATEQGAAAGTDPIGPVEIAAMPDQAEPAPPTKIAMVTGLLQREEGASLAELVQATGWLPHTTRAALTGLRKKGHGIIRTDRDGVSRYHIAAAA